ncbi:LapA family protein [Rhodopirellula sallentina]|uniref:Putative membrane protein n=1 Tax=Rhodopirellula sallentina SM41 TaxID=1263870 RepID=M5TYQ4_9BACT|nr:LapA family protein [Rhodopirellula sallentina]EMI54347.1 putative membrane protein [Rhodopirellula sallentina SM41]
MLQKIRYFLFLTAVLVVIVVAFQNHHEVDIDLLFFSGQYPLTLLLLACSAVSFILGAVWTMWRLRKREKAKARAKSDAAAADSGKSDKQPAKDSGQPNDAVKELGG